MNDVRERVQDIKRSLVDFIKHETLVALTKSIEGDTDRVEVHLLDVHPNESFAAMESTVEHLSGDFGELPWLVFAHTPDASPHVRARFTNRAERLFPLGGWHTTYVFHPTPEMLGWERVLLTVALGDSPHLSPTKGQLTSFQPRLFERLEAPCHSYMFFSALTVYWPASLDATPGELASYEWTSDSAVPISQQDVYGAAA